MRERTGAEGVLSISCYNRREGPLISPPTQAAHSRGKTRPQKEREAMLEKGNRPERTSTAGTVHLLEEKSNCIKGWNGDIKKVIGTFLLWKI